MTKSLMVFVAVVIVGGAVASVAQAGHMGVKDTPGFMGSAAHGFTGETNIVLGGEAALRGIDWIWAREPDYLGHVSWENSPGYAGQAWGDPRSDGISSIDYVSAQVDPDGTQYIKWKFGPRDESKPASPAWFDGDLAGTERATDLWTYLDLVVTNPEGNLPNKQWKGPTTRPGWVEKPPVVQSEDYMTMEMRARFAPLNADGDNWGTWQTYVLGAPMNRGMDSPWGRVWYYGRPGQFDEFFVDGEFVLQNAENHLWGGMLTSESYADLLTAAGTENPLGGNEWFPEDDGVLNHFITYRWTSEPSDETEFAGVVRTNADGTETPLSRTYSLYMTADPDGFGGDADDGSWGADGTPYLVGRAPYAAASWNNFHGMFFANNRSQWHRGGITGLSDTGAAEVDHDYYLFDYTDAYPPIPEPATLGLLALGGLLALRRQRG